MTSALHEKPVRTAYHAYLARKTLVLLSACAILTLFFLACMAFGPVGIPLADVVGSLTGVDASTRFQVIIWNIRLPNALTAVLAGSGLAAAGAAMQSILRNPLASPFTLGISQAGAFGAAFAVMFLGTGVMQSTAVNAVSVSDPILTSVFAFAASLAASLVIIAVARLRGASPEVMVLCGVALGSLFTAATMLLQYFASDVQLAAMVFWSFGDLSRAGWREVGILGATTLAAVVFFYWNRWNYNALDAGDETARGLGVRVERVRLQGMIVASILTAVIVSSLGVIGFIGLVSPHIVRRLLGDDHRFLLPGSCLFGAILLQASDILSRMALAPHLLPVSVVTALIGAPAFFSILLRRGRQ